ncbi:MAG: hypothetical protein AAFW74_08310, partial [Pseudomonadota bacterium]
MRSPSVFFLLAVAGTALSGCASGFDDAYIGSAAITDGPGGDGLSGDEPSGEDNGGDLPAGAGDNSIVFTDGSRVVDGTARTALTINTDPNDPNQFTTATVLVDPGQPIGFVGEQQVAIFEHKTSNPEVEDANAAADFWLEDHAVEGSVYSEFRRISPSEGVDVELQYWDFTGAAGTENYVAHFRDATNDQDAWFFGEADNAASRTTADQIAALGGATLNYQGSYVGQAKTTGWGQASTYQSRDGAWRVQGHAEVSLDLGADQLNGTLTPQFWEKTESDGTLVQIDVHRQPGDEYVVLSTLTVDPANPVPPIANPTDIAAFHNAEVQLEGTITDQGAINGTATVVDAG